MLFYIQRVKETAAKNKTIKGLSKTKTWNHIWGWSPGVEWLSIHKA